MTGSIGTISLITKTGEFERKYFLNNPDITFFKSVYRKHTNFSKYFKTDSLAPANSTELQQNKDIQTGSEDLLAKIYLENKITIKKTAAGTGLEIFANLGSNFIENNDEEALSITIDNNRSVFKSYGLFQEVKGELLFYNWNRKKLNKLRKSNPITMAKLDRILTLDMAGKLTK